MKVICDGIKVVGLVGLVCQEGDRLSNEIAGF